MNECLLPWTVTSPGAVLSIPVPLPASLWSLKQSSREAGTERLSGNRCWAGGCGLLTESSEEISEPFGEAGA